MRSEEQGSVVELISAIAKTQQMFEAKSLDVLFSRLHDLTADFEPQGDLGEDHVKVLELLKPEKSEWVAAGVPLEEICAWENLGLDARRAGAWFAAGLSVVDAVLWSALVGRSLKILDPQMVAGWEKRIPELYGNGYSRGDIVLLVSSGVPADPGLDWWFAGWGMSPLGDFLKWMNEFGDRVDPLILLAGFHRGVSINRAKLWFGFLEYVCR